MPSASPPPAAAEVARKERRFIFGTKFIMPLPYALAAA
jgi:hypothetical protein